MNSFDRLGSDGLPISGGGSQMERLRTGRLVDLSLPIMNYSMEPAEFVPRITYQTAAETARQFARDLDINVHDIPTGRLFSEEFVSLAVHSGTHMDAPYHYGPASDGGNGRTIDEVPLEWCCGNGVVLDFTFKAEKEAITGSDVASGLARIEYELREWDVVLLRTGWDKRFGSPDYTTTHPGPDASACEYLLDRGVRVIGIDANALDLPLEVCLEKLKGGEPAAFLPCHYLGRRREYLQIEKLANLDKLPPVGFTVFAFPVLIERCGASWIRAVGLVEGEETDRPVGTSERIP
jgi:kynurenine formamidase